MELHEVIKHILKQANKPLTCTEIAEKVNDSKLYPKRNDVPSNQISARINRKKYSYLFKKDKTVRPMLISLSE